MPRRPRLPLIVVGLALCASPALAVTARIHVDAPLLTGPARSYSSVGVVPAATRLDVIWCGTGGNWCLVEVKDRLGWVPLSSLAFHKQQDVVSVVQQGNGSGPSGPPPADPSEPITPPTIKGPVTNTLKAPDDGPQQAKPIVSDGPAPHTQLADPPQANGNTGIHVDAPIQTIPFKK